MLSNLSADGCRQSPTSADIFKFIIFRVNQRLSAAVRGQAFSG
jgi:hypothetical protein